MDLIKKLNADSKKVSPEQLAAILTFVLKGLNYLHARGWFVHFFLNNQEQFTET